MLVNIVFNDYIYFYEKFELFLFFEIFGNFWKLK